MFYTHVMLFHPLTCKIGVVCFKGKINTILILMTVWMTFKTISLPDRIKPLILFSLPDYTKGKRTLKIT